MPVMGIGAYIYDSFEFFYDFFDIHKLIPYNDAQKSGPFYHSVVKGLVWGRCQKGLGNV